jgi:hypothetical protein
MEVSGQLHASTTLSPGKEPLAPIGQERNKSYATHRADRCSGYIQDPLLTGKVKLSLCLNKHYSMKAYCGVEE